METRGGEVRLSHWNLNIVAESAGVAGAPPITSATSVELHWNVFFVLARCYEFLADVNFRFQCSIFVRPQLCGGAKNSARLQLDGG